MQVIDLARIRIQLTDHQKYPRSISGGRSSRLQHLVQKCPKKEHFIGGISFEA
jgi:hypothetical protein